MAITNKKIAVLVDNYFEQSEFEHPLRQLKSAGADVTVVGAKTRKLQGLRHVDKGDEFSADILLDSADPDDYDALVLPGGAINADALRMNNKARRWVDKYTDDHKLIAAICHAPWLLVSADIVEGRRLTSYFTIQDDIRNAGGEWIDQPVVVDDNLITSRQPDDLDAFCHAITNWYAHAHV